MSPRGMLSHEFCLVPRGDTPTSGRLYASLACRCVPLVIANRFREHYAFAAAGRYDTWTVSVPEGEFLKAPRAAVERAIGAARPRLAASTVTSVRTRTTHPTRCVSCPRRWAVARVCVWSSRACAHYM